MAILTLLLYTFIIALALCYVVLVINRGARRPKPLPPGPTPWPILGNLPQVGTIPHHSLAAMAKTYGPLMYLRFGYVDVVVASSASVASQFLKTHDANFTNRPQNSGPKHLAYDSHDLVFAPYGQRWRMLRKICSLKLFSAKALANFCHVRQEEVTRLARALVGARKSAVRLDQLLNVCTSNVIARLSVGKRVFGDESVPQANNFKEMVVELMALGGEFNIGDFIPVVDLLDLQGIAKRMKKLNARFDSFFNTILEEHKSSNVGELDRVDLLTTLMDDADCDGTKLSEIEIKALFVNLFTAGTDTTNVAVEWAIAELIRHPLLLKQAQEEIDTIVGRDRLVTESDLSQLSLLQAIVKETLRLHPPSPLSLPRISSESCEVDGYHIPKGSTLLVNVWAIARDPKIWSEPLEFRPTRFLPGGEKNEVDVRGQNFEVIPFGSGKRMCAGLNLGLRMVHLLIATLVQGFDWELANGLDAQKLNMDEAGGLTLQRAEPLMLHPKPRLAPHVYESG